MNPLDGTNLPPSLAEAELPHLEAQLRAEYARKRQEYSGRVYHAPRSDRNDVWWTKAALLCQELQADPVEFIRVAFSHRWGRDDGPFVNQITGPAMRRIWAQNKPKPNEKSLSDKILQYTQYNWLRQCARSRQRGQDFLMDTFTLGRHPAWARLVLASRWPEVFVVWAPTAREELVGNPDLRAWMAKNHPDLLTRLLASK